MGLEILRMLVWSHYCIVFSVSMSLLQPCLKFVYDVVLFVSCSLKNCP
ncbi:Uncharacterised protein [Klebsiella grimontii]|nr:hypothetical protein WP4W18E05_11580 [Klebsiella sp. WP4-W18-ESBL-05]STR35876.1 Uncharacterised protein [Klebsiella grimontii]